MRGFLKRRRQRRTVAQHLQQHGGFRFRGQQVVVPFDLALGIQCIIADGSYEAAECDLIERFLQDDVPVIELGGCLGLVSSLVASRLSGHTKFIVVEANPTLLAACRGNATLAGTRENTTVLAKAIAYGDAQVRFDVRDNVHVSKLNRGGEAAGTLVDSVRLRDLVGMIGEPFSYTLICDIEGAEIDLLENDVDALKTCKLVIMELHPEAYETTGHSVDGVVEIMRCVGLEKVAQADYVYAFQRSELAVS